MKSDFQEKPIIIIFNKKNTVKLMYEHQVKPNFSLLYEIHHIQAFLETIKKIYFIKLNIIKVLAMQRKQLD